MHFFSLLDNILQEKIYYTFLSTDVQKIIFIKNRVEYKLSVIVINFPQSELLWLMRL